MLSENPQHLDFQAISKTSYWSAVSQMFAGAHNLLWAIDQGWQLDPSVTCVEYPCYSTCSVKVYHFTLHRNHNTLVMPVINTPYLVGLIAESRFQTLLTISQDGAVRASVVQSPATG